MSRASLTLGKDLKKLVETLDKKNCRGPNGWASAAVTQQAKFAESIFAESLCLRPLCQGPGFAEGSWGWPLAKTVFAECPRFGPRQSLRPLAKRTFPAVIVPEFARCLLGLWLYRLLLHCYWMGGLANAWGHMMVGNMGLNCKQNRTNW